MPPTTEIPLFLALPSEVRALILTLASQNNPSPTSLLLINHEVRREAIACLYSRPASFQSQTDLSAWLSRSHSTNLARVQEISLRLQDIDTLCRVDTDPRKPLLWTMYADELAKLCAGFGKLPNLRAVRILDPRSLHSFLFRDMHCRFLQRLPALLPPGCAYSIPDVSGCGFVDGARDEDEGELIADGKEGKADSPLATPLMVSAVVPVVGKLCSDARMVRCQSAPSGVRPPVAERLCARGRRM